MDLGLTGKAAFVTGAANGIGACIAEMLAREGASVAIVDIARPAAEVLATRLANQGLRVIGLAADVTNAESVAEAFTAAKAALGPVDILVNNAGFTRDSRIGKMDEGAWDAVVDVVLKGAFLCTKAALPDMIERRWGRVVNISSRAYLGNPGQANYSAAKAGLLGFTRAMSLENGKYNITVNAVAPGIVDTAAVRALPHYEKVKAAAESTLPLPRLGRVEDVASAVAFLASEPAGYITGDVLHVTGGRY